MRLAGFVVAGLAVACGAAQAQASDIPRTADGRPDFQGVWESLWLTPLERAPDIPGDIPATDVERVMTMFTTREANRATSQLDTEGEIAIAAKIMSVGGVYRSSQVIDPPDGRIPRTALGKARQATPPQTDGPEVFPRGVRCITGINTGPMRTTNFDMLHLVVQTPDNVVLYSESISDVRILPIRAPLPANWPRTFSGSSAAHWDGDVLVVETTHFDGSEAAGGGPTPTPLGDKGSLVERIYLNGPDELVIHYTVSDPDHYTQPWTAEVAWVRTSQPLYPTACHEANYSLANMLLGARIEEAQARTLEAGR